MDKGLDIAVGGAVTEYTINHGACLFCGLCVDVCPTGCLQMGPIHDHSCYRRDDLITDYVALAESGRNNKDSAPWNELRAGDGPGSASSGPVSNHERSKGGYSG